MRVLLVEDDAETRTLVAEALRAGGFVVDTAGDVDGAMGALGDGEYDAVVLDWMLPDGSGVDLCRSIRGAGRRMPVMMLTARGDVADRVAGLNAGADDYLRKPFAVAELVARLRALMRRRGSVVDPVVRIGRAEVDFAARRATLDGREVLLTAREFTLLESLVADRGRALPRAEILRRVWHDETAGASASLEVLISRLRRKLSAPGVPCPIRTHRGYGYSVSEDS